MTTNEAVARDGIAAWNGRDLKAWLASVDPSARFYPLDNFPDFDTVYEGHVGFASFWDRWFEPWDQLRAEIVAIHDDGDVVVFDSRWVGERKGAPPVEMPVGIALTVRDALVTLIVAGQTGADARDRLVAITLDPSAP